MTIKKHPTLLIPALLLAALVAVVYWQAAGFELIALDDYEYTVQNPVVKDGLTISGLKNVFSTEKLHNFMPVTQLSYMIDAEVFDLRPGGFHFTNILLHLFNSLLLFAFLFRATGSRWKSFFAAALWAVHPLRAESVAWVAERNDLLAGFFFLIGLVVYREYAKERRKLLYAAALLSMLLGLASKPSVVGFPAVLLILDFWPLKRFGREGGPLKKLLVEKIPFLALSAAFAVSTLVYSIPTIQKVEARGFAGRLADVATSYLYYIWETFWPVGLFMGNRATTPALAGLWAVAAGILLIGLTYLALRFRKAAPPVSAGWLWYLAMLFPVSGIVPLDFYFVADHFTYLPHIGLAVALVWGAELLYLRFAPDLRPLGAAGGVIAAVLCVLCFRQVSVWENDYVFFGYVDRMSGGKSAMAKNGLAVASLREGKFQEAYDLFSATLNLEPNYSRANGYKGMAAAKLGRYREAAFLVRKQLQNTPGEREISIRLANILILGGDLPGGAKQALENIKQWPEDKVAWEAITYLGGEFKANMVAGTDSANKNLFGDAARYFSEAVRLSPGDYNARISLAEALRRTGDIGGAQRETAEAKRLNPGAAHSP